MEAVGNDRKRVLLFIFYSLAIVYILRLFFLQIIDDQYKHSADNQSLRYVDKYAPRGLIFDRNGKKIVYNEPLYDLWVVPKHIDETFDTLKFCSLFEVSKEWFENKIIKTKNHSRHKPSVFISSLSVSEYAPMMEKMFLFPEFELRFRENRKIDGGIAPHVIGYVGEVGRRELARDSTYQMGDYIGKSGVEKTFENVLRGEDGYAIFLADSRNVLKERLLNGEKDKIALEGLDLTLGIDAALQAYGEQLMNKKKGAIVAIEPASGEVLAFISAPYYDPNLLVGRKRSQNYQDLSNNDSLKPLFNRALMAEYPPGSIFKLLQSIIALKTGVISENTGFSCDKNIVGCHDHPHPSTIQKAVQYSCNPYFYKAFKRVMLGDKANNNYKAAASGLSKWEEDIYSFGLGKKLGIDLPGEHSGQVPGASFYNTLYGEYRWSFSTIASISIGQGELLVTPLQMANMAAVIANRGWYYAPHIVKGVEGDTLSLHFTEKQYSTISEEYFGPIIEGMSRVANKPGGTARRAKIKDIEVCGKTGTAQNPHGEDHSIFIAFAPRIQPKIAISVYIENAGFGGTWAAPIASLMMEKYLKGEVDSVKEKRIIEKTFY